MHNSIAATVPGTPQQKLSDVHGVPVKANLHPKVPETPLREIAKDTIQLLGKQESAAGDIEISAGRLSAKLADGSITVKQLESLGIDYAVRFAEEILRQLGPLATPKMRARHTLHRIRQAVEELDQYLEYIA